MKVYLGLDGRELDAMRVAKDSLLRRSSVPVELIQLDAARLSACGMLNRPVDDRGGLYDLISGAPMATEFANTRFFVPLLAHSGWALFADCDVIFLRDIAEIQPLLDPSKAVMVVKHNYRPAESVKMVGAKQTVYPRKNWSSVIAWNCDHPANRRLNLSMLNSLPGRDLHAFSWLHDDEVGELPADWNWLVNVQPRPIAPAIAHFTLGGPWIKGWSPAPNDDIWITESAK